MRWFAVPFILMFVAASAGAAEPGNLWQIETSMEMPGMKMPAQSQQVCAPVTAEGPEAMAGEDSDCKMTNVRRTPGKFSYDVSCPQGSGQGEMIYEGKDSYTSRMTMTTEGQTMTMVSRGRKVGACDASAVRKQVEAAQAQAVAGMEQACASMVDTMMPANLETYQCAPRYKQDLCRKFETKAGFAEVAPRQPIGNPALDSATLPEVARFCGVDAEGLRARLCGEANRSEDLEFLGSSCPAQAQVIAQRECAGRSFTTPPAARYRDFCGQYARAMMQDGSGDGAAQDPEASGAPADEAVREGAKRLKGMLGF